VAKLGANHHRFGVVAHNAVSVHILNLDGELIASFSSQVKAAKYLGVYNSTVAAQELSNSVTLLKALM